MAAGEEHTSKEQNLFARMGVLGRGDAGHNFGDIQRACLRFFLGVQGEVAENGHECQPSQRQFQWTLR